MPVNLQEDGVLLKAQETTAHSPSSMDQDAAWKKGEIKKNAEKLVDELTDYICENVTESLKPIQTVIEKKIIMRALVEAGGSQKRAARILGIKYTTLNYKVKKHKIRIKKIVSAAQDNLLELSRDSKVRT